MSQKISFQWLGILKYEIGKDPDPNLGFVTYKNFAVAGLLSMKTAFCHFLEKGTKASY